MLLDGITSLTAPYTTFFSGGALAPRSQAMDQNLQDIIRDQIATTGKGSGIIGYSDFDKSQTPGTEFPNLTTMMTDLAKGEITPSEFANATTLGRLTYDVDPNTGKVSFGSNVYDFRPDVADQGGIKGLFATMANERAREINPNITIPVDELRGFARDFSQFDQAKMGGTRQPSSFRSMNNPEVYGDIEEKEGILSKFNPMKALGFLANVATGGLSNALTTTGLGTLFSKIAEAGKNTPNYQFANPNKSGFNRIASDFYDPRTGLDRFDRAKTLFGQSRTMKEFLDKLKDKRAAEKAAAAAKLADARRAIANAGSGFDDYAPGQGAGMGFGGGRTDPTDKS